MFYELIYFLVYLLIVLAILTIIAFSFAYYVGKQDEKYPEIPFGEKCYTIKSINENSSEVLVEADVCKYYKREDNLEGTCILKDLKRKDKKIFYGRKICKIK